MNKNPRGRSVRINGPALRHVRELTGLTVTGLAHDVGVTPTYVSMLELGTRVRCSADVFARITERLGIHDDRVLAIEAELVGAA